MLKNSGVKVTTLIDEPTGASPHEKRMEIAMSPRETPSHILTVYKEACKKLGVKPTVTDGMRWMYGDAE